MTKQSTTVTPAVAVKLAANKAMSPAELLKEAFKIGDKAALNTTTSTQTMAAGIFAYYSEVEGTKPRFAVFAEKGEAFKTFKTEMVERMTANGTIAARITAKEQKANSKITDAIAANANALNAAQMIALNKGFDLADGLHAAGVSNASFNPSTNLFSVPVSALIGSASPLYALKKLADTTGLVPLDGKTYYCDTDDKRESFKAYPARLIELAGFKKHKKVSVAANAVAAIKGASDTATTGGANAAEIHDTPATWSNEKAVEGAVYMLNMLLTNLKADAMPALSDLDPRLANGLTEIKAMFDDAYHAEQEKVNAAKKVA